MIGRKRRGLGSLLTNGILDCSAFPDVLNTACWFAPADIQTTMTPGAIQTGPYAGLKNPPVPVAVPGPQTEAQLTGAASWTPDQAMAAWSDAQKKQTLDFFKNLAASGAAGTPPRTPAGPPDCTSTWTYYTNSACPADCSRFVTNLFNSSCPGLGVGWKSAGILTIAAGVLLLVVVIRR